MIMMADTWGIIVGIIGLIFTIVVIILIIYTWKTPKPIPKPNIRFKELEDESNKIQFVIWNYINDPAMTKYLAFFTVFYKIGIKHKIFTKAWKPKTQTKNITNISPGTWKIDNFFNKLRNKKYFKLIQFVIKVDFEDNYGRKYCYCGVFKKGDNGDWVLDETKDKKDFDKFIRYWRWKCLKCWFKGVRR